MTYHGSLCRSFPGGRCGYYDFLAFERRAQEEQCREKDARRAGEVWTLFHDVMAKIAEALTSGASIIVSDQGINQGETGEGTDFIIPLR